MKPMSIPEMMLMRMALREYDRHIKCACGNECISYTETISKDGKATVFGQCHDCLKERKPASEPVEAQTVRGII